MSSSKGGRKKGVVNQYITNKGTDENGVTTFECSMPGCCFTRKTKQFQSSKWADHISSCDFASKEIKSHVAAGHRTKRTLEQAIQAESMNPASSNHSEFSITTTASKRQKVFTPIDHCNNERAANIIDKINRFLVGCAIPFNVVNSVFFIDMIKSINSAALKHIPKSASFRQTHLPQLFNDTVQKVNAMWNLSKKRFRTIGFDGFKTETGSHVVNFTQSIGKSTAFLSCVEPGENRENGEYYAKLVEEQLISITQASKSSIDEAFAGVVSDNVSYNRLAYTILSEKYPKLFYIGCAAHAFDLMCKDIAKVSYFEAAIAMARRVAKFVRNHKYVRAAFDRLKGPSGRTLTLFPSTRFSYAELMIDRIIRNKTILDQLIDEENWKVITKGISQTLVVQFESDINSNPWRKLSVIHDILRPVSLAIRHIEKQTAKASWIYMLGSSLLCFVATWSKKQKTIDVLQASVIKEVVDAVIGRWIGLGNRQVGILSNAHLVAWIVDPYTTPQVLQLPPHWEQNCLDVISKFYSNADEAEMCISEIKSLINREGPWGKLIDRKQSLISPPESKSFMSIVEREIWKQEKMMDTSVDWDVSGITQFPLLHPIAARLSLLTVHSAGVERVCKAHKVIQTKARNRLKNKNVHMLLFTYVNLRLLNNCSAAIVDFLDQCLDGIQDFDGDHEEGDESDSLNLMPETDESDPE